MITTPYPRIPHAHCAFHTVCRQRTTQGLRRERPGRTLAQQVYLAVSWTLANESRRAETASVERVVAGISCSLGNPAALHPAAAAARRSNARARSR